jgi:agmatine deiminase
MKTRVPALIGLLIFIFQPGAQAVDEGRDQRARCQALPLPRHEPGYIRPYDPDTARRPPVLYVPLTVPDLTAGPVVTTPPEYRRNSSLLLRWGDWNGLIKRVVQETAAPDNGMDVILLVGGDTKQARATAALTALGVDMSRVAFLRYKTNSVWVRDYGPHYIRLDGIRAMVDTLYYPGRPLDDALPAWIHELWGWPLHDFSVRHPGGNMQVTSNREGYITDILFSQNPGLEGQAAAALFEEYFGITALHVFPSFPPTIDRTGHIDMWMGIVGDHTAVIGEYGEANPSYEAALITEEAVAYMRNLGFIVFRTPAWNDGPGGYDGIHYTYTNCLVLKNKVLVPQYGGGRSAEDEAALAVFREALPARTVVGVDCASIIEFSGALHCIARNVPGPPPYK